ncbi:uroporphyrinogen decarboxylase [Mitsuaria sp. GD03876]|uniref:uroporphyrinogen decarboxylase n=1 Tax=Mitsuaria sp. GD03876 TaxID=2975399 RepID=UPI002448F9DD|nr:uroporphyrinogen decarboxylase [Mitsuaria sp. GD03876]MDH0865703.1 uroporphyrinogen decarboxylase [Mitsuaria sp. GD03876]
MSAPLQNDVFLRACLRQPTEYTPVWLMRQAGRYLPEYRDTRAKAGSFMGLATNTDYATEVTLQPLERYPLDAAILFSDILTVPDAMGLGLSFAQGEGPKFEKVVRDEAAVNALAVPDLDKLRYVFDAVSSIRRALNGRVPLIGFSGSPWTLACYMVEGGGSDDYRHVKSLMYARPDLMHRILEINADAVAAYLNAQIEAGAQAVMVFDSWGGVLADGQFQQFSLAYSRRVLAQVKGEHDGRRIPKLLFTKGGGLWLDEISGAGADVVGLDWTMNLGRARAQLQDRVALQGNLDPNVLFAPPAAVREQARRVLDSFGPPQRADGGWGGHVFNLGHGISQFTPPESVAELVDEVHRHSRALRAAGASKPT